jgi:hypothetical protein
MRNALQVIQIPAHPRRDLAKGFAAMNLPVAKFPSHEALTYLSRLLLPPQNRGTGTSPEGTTRANAPLTLPHDQQDLLRLAHSHHVVVRGLETVIRLTHEEQNPSSMQWAREALSVEKLRIARAIRFLQEICAVFHGQGYAITVIKSLDHWPDFGSDLDLFTTADPDEVLRLMTRSFSAQIERRSWGDVLAHKWNFLIPGLPESVEIHVGRLGQTGEQVAIAFSLTERARQICGGGGVFQVPSISHRLIISTLQRMYRHFNLRLCDIVNTASIADGGLIDYEDRRALANSAGIWEGVATYLAIISDYVKTYRGAGLKLPQFVQAAARFGGSEVYYDQGFLRVPIMPHSVRLYGSELVRVLKRGELHNGARLGLLPLLGTAAMAKQRLTGSDKGIW